MPKIKNWSYDGKRPNSRFLQHVYLHDKERINLAVSGSTGDYDVRGQDNRSGSTRDYVVESGIKTKSKARDIAVDWMKNHPNGPEGK